MSTRRGLFRVNGLETKTYIGGVSATITTASALAAKLNSATYPVLESNIASFAIVGNDIEAVINVDYSVPTTAFKDNLNITYFNDAGNRCKYLGTFAFQFAYNLQYVKFNGVISIERLVFSYCTSLISLESNALQTLLGTFTFNRVLVPEFNFPNLTSAADGAFASEITGRQDLINIPLCSVLGGSTINNNVFQNIKTTCEIVCPVSLQTANAGAEEGDVAYARGRGCTITYI